MKTEAFLRNRLEFLDKNANCIWRHNTPLETVRIHGIGALTEDSSKATLHQIVDMIRIQAKNTRVELEDDPQEYIRELMKEFG